MGGLELGLSELAALRPIRTGAGTGDAGGDAVAAGGGGGTVCCAVAPLVTAVAVVDASDGVGEFMETRKDGGVVVDDAAGCVTPTARRDGGGEEEEEEDGAGIGVGIGIGGCVTPTASARRFGGGEEEDGVGSGDAGFVTPMARRVGGGGGEEDGAGIDIGVGSGDVGFVTPMSAASALGQPTVCPPAPRKPGTAKRKSCGRGTPRRFFFSVPHDLDAVFVPSSPPLTPPSAKKTRVHVVG